MARGLSEAGKVTKGHLGRGQAEVDLGSLWEEDTTISLKAMDFKEVGAEEVMGEILEEEEISGDPKCLDRFFTNEMELRKFSSSVYFSDGLDEYIKKQS